MKVIIANKGIHLLRNHLAAGRVFIRVGITVELDLAETN